MGFQGLCFSGCVQSDHTLGHEFCIENDEFCISNDEIII